MAAIEIKFPGTNGTVSSTAAIETELFQGTNGTILNFNDNQTPQRQGGPRKCDLPAEGGFCRAFMPKMHYDAEAGGCRWFVYGGCPGNANRFTDQAACCEACGDVTFREGSELPGVEGCLARSDSRTADEYADSLRTARPPFLGR